jgi:hypothetical protein
MTSQPPRKGSRPRQFAWLLVAAGIIRSRPFLEQVIIAAIVVAALAGIGRQGQANTWLRIRAWVRRIDQRTERMVKEIKL